MARSKTSTYSKDSGNSTILSITSATTDWNVVFVDIDNGEVWLEPVACFALCENDKKEKFIGSIISKDHHGLCIAEDVSNFVGISTPSEVADEIMDTWKEIAHNKFKLNGSSSLKRKTVARKAKSVDESDLDDEYDDDELENKDGSDEPEVVSRRKSVR